MRQAIVVLVTASVLAVTLAACGKKGEPAPPGPAGAITYPKSYPKTP